MAYFFGDSFDCYSAPADAILGYWDTGNVGYGLSTGRFAGSRAITLTNISASIAILQKSSGANDAIHHVVVAVQQIGVVGAQSVYGWITFYDGATAQCSIGFSRDGSILLISGASNGTVLDTYSGAVPATNTWYGFEIEVVIHNTAGSWAVRKNGNTTNDRALGSLNTRAGTANNYANRLSIGSGGPSMHVFDDLLWRSDPTSVPWLGDIRCQTRYPATDVAAQWTRPATLQQPSSTGSTLANTFANNAQRYSAFIAQSSSLSGATITMALSLTGNMKCTLFANNVSNQPGAIIQSATAPLNNPVAGVNTFTFSPAVTLTRGTQYWLGFAVDTTLANDMLVVNSGVGLTSGFLGNGSLTYAAFPAASPVVTAPTAAVICALVFTPSSNNEFVADPLGVDFAATYLSDSTTGHNDLYTIGAIASSPATVVAVTTRGCFQKSDAGTRAAAVQLKSGSTTVQATPLALPAGSWSWNYRVDTVDPATGSAWTPPAVNAVNIGVVVTT